MHSEDQDTGRSLEDKWMVVGGKENITIQTFSNLHRLISREIVEKVGFETTLVE
ncbi:hypothetical protein [Bacillus sp. BHET2]|uniref:hypothetical protein n=1 Tax=Bacillus sp. BHET2 TaxID=2583818 RepID=UPI0014873B3D|nr:hypothetical protein [Bacillus sp. BHET2]